MSLGKMYKSIFDKNLVDSSDTLNTYKKYFGKDFEDLSHHDELANIMSSPLDSQMSSQFSEISKSSFEVDGVRFSQEIEKILAKHLKQSSVVEKNVKNNYQGLLNGLKGTSLGKISEVSYEDSQKENQNESKRSQLELENGSKNPSFIDQESHSVLTENPKKKTETKQKKQVIGNTHTSLRNSTFALANRIFCLKCSAEVYTNVNYQMKKMNLWGSIGFFFEAVKCCGEPRLLSRYQELVHTCKNCGSIVARISTN
ncbi:hypothetical protein SteCoe_26719 [Stentor coeruleus]|uniref:LITAF domain-containing protein n=1 Tax=Stentor coeruleus TaxID=5963 RepID=A0A1R2BC60_9CILI|nr:hypothetical protein SteCoe_26719 [Stentor coeruleus]